LMLHTMAASCRSASMSASSDFVTAATASTGAAADFCRHARHYKYITSIWVALNCGHFRACAPS
jgi:hypothetical protein